MFVLPRGNRYGDFATEADYTWTNEQRKAWNNQRTAPIALADMCANTNFATYTFHVPKHRRARDGDVCITSADFQRLEETPKATFSFWNILPAAGVMLRKDAIVFTVEQRQAYRDGKVDDRNASCLGDCLAPGFRLEDRKIDAAGFIILPENFKAHTTTAEQLVQSLQSA